MVQAAAHLPVIETRITRNLPGLNASASYPRTGMKAIDRILETYARRQLAQVDPPDDDDRAHGARYSLGVSYDVARNDDRMFIVTFTVSSDLGGMHPNTSQASFDFLLPDGAQVFLPEILDGRRGLEQVSNLAIAQLARTLHIAPGTPEDAVLRGGAAAHAENYAVFEWRPAELRFLFPAMQVASYADGAQTVKIPRDALKGFLRPDWRAPAASFDCAKAAGAMERAICSDAGLARLDRQVAEAYGARLRDAGAAAKQRDVADQRDWLTLRDKTCSADPACLIRLYRTRLAAFN